MKVRFRASDDAELASEAIEDNRLLILRKFVLIDIMEVLV